MATPLYLQDDNEVSSRWIDNGDGTFTVSVLTPQMVLGPPYTDDECREESTVTVDELSQVHAGLPSAVGAVIKWYDREYGFDYGLGDEVIATMNYLLYPTLEFTDLQGKTQYINHIQTLPQAITDSSVLLQGDILTLDSVRHKGQHVTIAVQRQHSGVYVNRLEIDTQYPGWLQRMEVGQGLGLTEDELLAYMFTPEQTPDVDKESRAVLENTQFD